MILNTQNFRREIEEWKQQFKLTQDDCNKQNDQLRNTNEDVANLKAQNMSLQHEVRTVKISWNVSVGWHIRFDWLRPDFSCYSQFV